MHMYLNTHALDLPSSRLEGRQIGAMRARHLRNPGIVRNSEP